MDKLESAIARAREKRQGVIGSVPGALFDSGRNFAQSDPVVGPGPSGSRLNFQYERTRVVELNPRHLERNRVIAGRFDDARVEAYRHLRTQVLQLFASSGWSTLAITSPHEAAGKTLTAVNLAISLAHELTHTVLLVDLDLKKPNVHTTLGFEIDAGVVEVVQGKATVEQVLVNPSVERMVVFPARPAATNPSELLSSPAMLGLVEELKARYQSRVVIFDLPPLLRDDDALKISPIADATLLVVEEGATTEAEVERSLHLLRHANVVGTLLNKAK